MSTATWNLDSSHSSIDFTVKHMGIFTVRGSLGTISGTATTEGDAITGVNLSIDISAISTGNDQRDGHLKSADFLNVAEYPKVEFKSTTIESKGGGEYLVTGDLTLLATTKPVTITLTSVPPVTDPWGMQRAGVTGSGVLLRSEYGLTYNSVMETGHALISDEIKFTFDVQAVAA
jgi:polyisoprenoid-binding protein YceI